MITVLRLTSLRITPPLSLLLLPVLSASTSAQTPALGQTNRSASAPAAPLPTPDSSASAAPLPPPVGLIPTGTRKEKKHRFEVPKIGIDLGIFLPSSGKTRSRFGKSWSDIGIGIGRPDQPSGTGRISLDFSTEYKKSGENHAFAAPIGVSYRRAFSAEALKNGSTFIPYYGLSADLVAVDLHSVEDNVHSRFRLTEGGSVVLGSTVGASGFVEGKYTAIGKVQGFDLSGIKLAVGIRF